MTERGKHLKNSRICYRTTAGPRNGGCAGSFFYIYPEKFSRRCAGFSNNLCTFARRYFSYGEKIKKTDTEPASQENTKKGDDFYIEPSPLINK